MTGGGNPIAPLALVALLATTAGAEQLVEGRVVERRENRLVPLPKVLVWASEQGGDLVAAAKTDAEGRYRLNLPTGGRIRLQAKRTGFFVETAEAADPYVVADCSVSCGPFRFVLARAAAIEGVIADDLGEPVANARIEVFLESENGGRRRAAVARSDDRGYFRAGGLLPGLYRVETQASARAWSETAYETGTVLLELDAGDERDLRVIALPAGRRAFRVAGAVVGVDSFEDGRHSVVLRPAGEGGNRGRRGPRVGLADRNGAFSFENVAPGRYLASLQRASKRARDPVPLGVIDVAADRENLTLSPQPAVSVQAQVRIDGQVEASEARFLLRSLDHGFVRGLTFRRPALESDAGGLFQGRYRLSVRTPELWLRELRVGGRTVSARDFELRAGAAELRILASAEFADVSGRVKRPAQAQPGAHHRVALSSPDGVRSAQTDQFGRFQFDRVAPGEYRIGAWPDVSAAQAEEKELWTQENPAIRTFTADPGSEIEIDLTAVR